MNNPTIETDIAEILKELKQGQKEILKEVSDIKVSLATTNGKVEALDGKLEQINTRVGNIEFSNRGILVGLILVVLGGAAKLFGFDV